MDVLIDGIFYSIHIFINGIFTSLSCLVLIVTLLYTCSSKKSQTEVKPNVPVAAPSVLSVAPIGSTTTGSSISRPIEKTNVKKEKSQKSKKGNQSEKSRRAMDSMKIMKGKSNLKKIRPKTEKVEKKQRDDSDSQHTELINVPLGKAGDTTSKINKRKENDRSKASRRVTFAKNLEHYGNSIEENPTQNEITT